MNSRRLLLATLPSLFLTGLAASQPVALDSLEKASIRLLEWFKALGGSLDAIVAMERKSQLVGALSDFSDDLYAIELDKAALIQLLKRDRLNRQYIYQRTGELMSSIERARQSLRKVGPMLRLQYASGGIEVEKLLSDAALARKVWVSELYEGGPAIPNREAAVAEGERALTALQLANAELAKLLSKLK